MAQVGPVAWLCRLGRGRSGVTAPYLDSPLILLLSAPLLRLPAHQFRCAGSPRFHFLFPHILACWHFNFSCLHSANSVSACLLIFFLQKFHGYLSSTIVSFHFCGVVGDRGRVIFKKITLCYYFDSVLMTRQR